MNMNPSLSVVNRYIEAEDVFQSAMHTFSDTQELFQAQHLPHQRGGPAPNAAVCQSPAVCDTLALSGSGDWPRAHSYYASS